MFTYQKLNRNNFRTWKLDVVCHLEQEGVSKWINKKTQPTLPEGHSFSDSLKLEQLKEKAIGLLKGSCDQETRQIIENFTDPAEAWEALSTAFEATSRARKAYVLTEYMNIRLISDEPMSIFISRFETAYKRVEGAGETISESQRCYQLIRYLPDTYDGLVREIYNAEDEDFTFKKIKEKLLNEYGRKSIKEEERHMTQDSFATTSNSMQKLNIKKQVSNKPKLKLKCYQCGLMGHISRQCTKNRNRSSTEIPNRQKNVQRNGSSFLADLVPEYEANCTDEKLKTLDWTVDSATTAHICQNKDFFTTMKKPPEESIVRMGVTPHKVEGIGLVKFRVRDRGLMKHVTLNNVLYVPSINRNLISMIKMEDADMHAKLDGGIRIYTSRWKYLFTARRMNNFYILRGILYGRNRSDGEAEIENSSYFSDGNSLMKWHERYGHCSINTLKQMCQKQLVIGLDNLTGQEEVCEYCQLAKSTRSSHPRLQDIRSKDLLELIHADVWGPAPVKSLKGYRYILTFIDDYSRRSFCYPLKTKDEVITKFKEFIQLVERQTNKKIRTMRTDNGLEFCNERLGNLFKHIGIKHERTSTYSPQMNGVAERYNRTLLEGVRAHLQVTRLPSYHWIEAVMATNYLRNRTLHSTIKDIPFRRWYGRKPSVKHLRRLGCVAYVHQHKTKRNKFEARAKKGILVGYGLGTTGYRVWFPFENTIIESRHVTFDERKLGGINGRNIEQDFVQAKPSVNFEDDEWENRPINSQILIKEKDEPKSSDDDENQLAEENMSHKEVITFDRTWTERQKGQTAGRLDIYYKTSDGETLRSLNDAKKYCEMKNLEFEESKFNFSTKDKSDHQISLEIKGNEFTTPEEDDKSENKDIEKECACGELLGEIYCADVKVPRTVKEANSFPEAKEWQKAMNDEIATMQKRDVWTLVPKPKDAKVIGSKWVFALKKNADGHLASYKARLVALGNNQLEGKDYEETYSPVVNFTLIRLFILLFVVILGWNHCLLDVKSAYLYGKMDKELYMRQPSGFVVKDKENYVLKIQKAIYGLHQSGRCWYNELHDKLLKNGFQEIPGMVCVYHYEGKGIIQVYVDDIPVYAKNEKILQEIVNVIQSIYEVKNLGPIKEFLGVKFNCSTNYAQINQTDYILKCAKKFNCDIFAKTYVPMTPGMLPTKLECPKTEGEINYMKNIPYRSLLGCLMYVASRSRPDIAYSVASLSQFCENPGKFHWNQLKNILYYLISTKDLGMEYSCQELPLQLTAFVDANWAADPTHRRSWSGYCIYLQGVPFAWRVSKQTCVAQSPMEAEFIAVSEVAKELKYASTVLSQLKDVFHFELEKPMIFCDSSAAIQFTKNRILNIRNRYIDLRYMFVRELYESGLFNINHVKSKNNIADIFTKPLKRSTFEFLRNYLLC